ncbi:hypothetical protein ACV3K4_12720 [Clostridium perfringens]|uniref:hypothetical protein n=1 Tax=Clostridium perfringens TaxID=1502 RepID=UPI0013E2A0EA|nr:hypothetical protein [Clostridium perfringens]MCC2765234.1 hypothetical protein [Clostridium perfringens]MCG4542246.1 hypothetical protein [Clostridium perfringens]MCG4544893.1 hypothetical protein [Clostridium perfringens]MCG4553548.1 hypothetical protein [Clostridium perfringens]MCG4556978.1 hypothetical protein [Clostridium perfringens]
MRREKRDKRTAMITIRCTPELKESFVEAYKKVGVNGTQVLEKAMREFIKYTGENC